LVKGLIMMPVVLPVHLVAVVVTNLLVALSWLDHGWATLRL
jgi:hypothetical protein